MRFKNSSLKPRLAFSLILSFFVTASLNHAAAEESQETIGITATDIKIGATFPQSGGAQYFYASFFAGANSYFNHLNQSGGVYGRKVYLISGDDQGLPTRAITSTNDLVLKSRVFALFNSSPLTPSHMAVANILRNRNIPDFYPTASFSGFRNTEKFPYLIAMGPSIQQEARVAATFSKDYFPEKSFTWRNNLIEGDIEVDVKNAWSNMGFTVKPISNDPNLGTIHLSNVLPSFAGSKKPLIVNGRTVSHTSRLVVFEPKDLADVYSINNLPLVTDKTDEFVKFFEEINTKYSNGAPFDAAFLEGANSAYVFTQALAAAGPNLTRTGLVQAFRTKGNTFSTATYGKLDFGKGVAAGKETFYMAKFDGSNWIQVGDIYTNELDSNLVLKGSVQRTKLLTNGLPTMSQKLVSSPITCVKGKLTKVLKGANTKCPAGYKKK
jgi:ABC-type branched-subunit amino acid transport system substrate-binding protein